jgi:CRP/FNR family transcriptional regulator, cyclic AMP receptor protein
MDKPFDPQIFLAKVGAGKSILKLEKNENVLVQGDIADTVYCIQKGKIKLTVIWRRLHERSSAAHRNHDRDGKLRHYGHYKTGHERYASQPACIFRAVRGISSDPEQPDRGRPDRPAFQFKRAAAGPHASAALAFRQGRQFADDHSEYQSGNIGEMIGTTRSRVSHFMNKFRKLGLINYNGHIEVNSSLLDAVLRDKPELKADE